MTPLFIVSPEQGKLYGAKLSLQDLERRRAAGPLRTAFGKLCSVFRRSRAACKQNGPHDAAR